MIDMLSGSVRSYSIVDGEYPSILSYPYDGEYARHILHELQGLGVRCIVIDGSVNINGYRVVGKGCSSIVIKGIYGDSTVAVKILRSDSSRQSVEHEASILKLVNGAGIGPRFIANSRHVLVMEYVHGNVIGEWLVHKSTQGGINGMKRVLGCLLEQCYTLDSMGVDHGELSNMYRHAIVTGESVCIIDFEGASIKRRAKNLTSAVQYLFLSPNSIQVEDKGLLVDMLREYKCNMSRAIFDRILRLLGIH
jgi:putative serine/threonine protein kinase